MAELQKVDLESKDLVAERIEQMKALFPEIATERNGGIDFEKLRLILGDAVEEGDEHYSFTWPGKADAIRLSQMTSNCTLLPSIDESVNWDTTENLYIEGDNLEVLKLMQKGYHSKIKMIYIDPPYNTGGDFVYSDSFDDPLENYKRQAGLEGQSHPITDGRYHAKWCDLMYPRIRLARELLEPKGVMFISIGNQELSSLLSICDEIFGDSCRLGIIAWESKTKCQNTSTAKRQLQPKQEYILVYARNPGRYEFALETKEEHVYDQVDENGKEFRYKRVEEMSSGGVRGRTTMIYPILGIMPGEGKQWKLGHETIEEYERRGDLLLRDGVPHFRCRPDDEEDSMLPFWSLIGKEIGTAETAKSALKQLMGETGFDTVKPVELLEKLILHVCGTDEDAIVMDFFAGSSTTAHAVMSYNLKHSKHLRAISVQFPEICSEKSDSKKAGYNNICEIGKRRLRVAGQTIIQEACGSNGHRNVADETTALPDVGFRVLKLGSSCINQPVEGQLLINRIDPNRNNLDIIIEMMLKWGVELTYPIREDEIEGYPVISIAYDELICCMHEGLTTNVLEAIAARQPRRVFMLDSVINDTIKLNAIQVFERAERHTQQPIELRTV